MMDYCRFRDINDFFANGQTQKARRLLMEMQSRCIALRDEIALLRIRLQTAEDALFISNNLFRSDGLYWLKTQSGRQGPYCPGCYDSEGALIHLEKYKRELICPYCHEGYALADTLSSAEAMPGGHARIFQFDAHY